MKDAPRCDWCRGYLAVTVHEVPDPRNPEKTLKVDVQCGVKIRNGATQPEVKG